MLCWIFQYPSLLGGISDEQGKVNSLYETPERVDSDEKESIRL